MNYSSNFK